MRINAYVMAADPAFLASSVASYYDVVERIVVSYDEQHKSWSGRPLPVDECLAELSEIDRSGKLDLQPGNYSHPNRAPLECDTEQRQAALAVASEGADWVIQLDADEVVPDLGRFVEWIERAATTAADGLHYPSRWLYARLARGRYLEGSTRFWRPAGAYPGPLAVRASVELKLARQCVGQLLRVDFRRRNTDPWHPRDVAVHGTVPVDAGVLHFSWIRDMAALVEKSQMSSHRDDVDWHAEIERWSWHRRHEYIAAALTPLRPRGEFHCGWLRIASVPVDPPPRIRTDTVPHS